MITNPTECEPHEDCLTKEDLAQRYRVTVRTIDNWMRVGMPYYKILKSVRFKWSAVQQCIDETKSFNRVGEAGGLRGQSQ
ncbi:MAG: helix-turn-helix domain-containing protein [Verrucomicrobia bacterium]|nr:helix-turn-helix domain-containing protein [Verrucomicrobiota bacterium]